jgi:DNA-binding transcriptional LysR family regulator
MSWDEVRLFLALSRAKTVGRAAHALGVDTSTVSRRLVALEASLGATLFYRGRSGVTPTKAAEDLLAVAEEIEGGVRRFLNAADGLERDPTGLVRIACPPDVAEVVLVPLVRELLARHAGLRVEIAAGEAVVDLTRREADLALRTARPTSGDLIVTRLRRVRWVAAAAPARATALGALRDWADAPWVGWSAPFGHLAAARWLSKHLRGTEPVLRSASLRVQLAAVVEGVGIALIPEPNVRHYGLVPVKLRPPLRPSAGEWPVDDLHLVTHRALRDVPRVRVVWEALRARWGTRGPGGAD